MGHVAASYFQEHELHAVSTPLAADRLSVRQATGRIIFLRPVPYGLNDWSFRNVPESKGLSCLHVSVLPLSTLGTPYLSSFDIHRYRAGRTTWCSRHGLLPSLEEQRILSERLRLKKH